MKPWLLSSPVWFAASLSLALACASKPTAKDTGPLSDTSNTSTQVEAEIATPTVVDPCAPKALAGRWLIQSGTARMKCDDGRESSITAGGSVELGADGDRLSMVDGTCRYGFSRNACEFVALTGGSCKQDATTYDVREVSLRGDRKGVLHMVYTLARKDSKGVVCTDSTEADLVARAASGCELGGRWSSRVTTAGTAGHVELKIEGGRCSIQSPEFFGDGACTIEAGQLIFHGDAASWGGSCGTDKAQYGFSIAAGCEGLVLESAQEGCAGRAGALDYLFLRRLR
jgi:hypothetical protein